MPRITVKRARTKGPLSWPKGTYVVMDGSAFRGAYESKSRATKIAKILRKQKDN